MIEPATIAGVTIGSKKLFIGIGAMAAMSSEKIVEGLPLLLVIALPLMTAAYFVGVAAKDIEHIHKAISDSNVDMRAYVDGKINEDKWKLNYVYIQATQGDRFTAADGKRHDVRLQALEKKTQGQSRFAEQGEKLERRVEKCEERLNNGER